MNWLEGINKVIDHIEEHLEEDIDYEDISRVFGYSVYHVQRLFAMVAGVPISEYIRKRRLSRAAADLQEGDCKVIDVAVKYGYTSSNSFNRAFKSFHGVAPSEARKKNVMLKAFPPIYFELTVRGLEALEYRIEKMKEFRIVGVKLASTMENGECYSKIPGFWMDLVKDGGQERIIGLMNREPVGLLGVSSYSDDFSTGALDYYIACSTDKAVPDGMEEFMVPESTWAAFPCRDRRPQGIQDLERRIVMEWLPGSGYEFANAPDLEVHVSPDETEIWIPVRKA
ncbi:MAG: AraC family transcriptional regulator [Clostridiales bacterium]|nr:MAG: AraC family transcriptional regulator [Clostridiales bacterium]